MGLELLRRGVYAIIAVCGLAGLLFLIFAVRRLRQWRLLAGSATFLPMADGALFQVSVSQSGLIARPLNQAGRDAVASWR